MKSFAQAIYIAALTLSCFNSYLLQAQDIQGNVSRYMKTPSVSSLEKFGNIPINLYTGVPEIKIPIYTINSRDIKLPITMSYHSGGIKVDEESGKIGLGWNLSSGGMIYRTIKGTDDLLYGSNGSVPYLDSALVDFTSDEPVGYWHHGFDVQIRRPTGGGSGTYHTLNLDPYLTQGEGQNKDFQPDEFSVSLPEYSGKFVINRKGKVIQERKDNTKIKLILDQSDRFKTKWLVTTGDGYRYYFEDVERVIPHPNSGMQPEYISAWFLSKIVSPAGSEILFKYTEESHWLVPNISNFYEQNNNYTVARAPIGGPCPSLTNLVRLPSSDYKVKYLNAIEFQNGKLEFDYSTRIDRQIEKKLDEIRLETLQGALIEKFTFSYGYFTSNAAAYMPPVFENNNYSTKRLKLNAFTRDMDGNREVYTFEYEEGSLPPKYSLGRDHWGYFNGAYNTTLIPEYLGAIEIDFTEPDIKIISDYKGADRNPSESNSKAFNLKKIVYPPGGYTTFDYELNDYNILKSAYDYKKFEYHWSKEKIDYHRSSEGNQTKRLTIQIPETDEEDDGYARLKIKAEVLKTSYDPATSYNRIGYFRITDQTGYVFGEQKLNDIREYTTYGTSYVVDLEEVYALHAGTYFIDVYLENTIDWIMNLNLECRWLQLPDTYIANTTFKKGGGLRVKRITDYDNITSVSNVRSFEYGKILVNDKYHSFGRIMSPPRYDDYVENLGGVFDCEHFLLSASSTYDLFSGNGVIVGYDTVVTITGVNAEVSGKKMSIFHNISDQTIGYVGRRHPSGLNNLAHWFNGTQKKEIDYAFNSQTSGFYIIAEKEYQYSANLGKRTFGMYWRNIGPAIGSTGGIYPIEVFFYPSVHSTWIRLDNVKETIYSGSKAIVKEISNWYDVGTLSPKNYSAKKVTTKSSDNTQSIREYYYATDFEAFPTDGKYLLTKMNFIDVPIEVLNKIKKGNDDELVTQGILNEFRVVGATATAPSKFFLFKTRKLNVSTPVQQMDLQPLMITNIINTRYELDKEFVFDPVSSTLTDIIGRGGQNSSYKWGYNNEYPIANCVNALSAEFFYTGFEDDGSLGNAHLGKRFHNGDYTVSFLPPNQRTYKCSYWYRENGVWKYDQLVNYSGITVLSLGDAIDDVRVFPANANLTTYHYIPAVGLWSTTDANDQTSYFEYYSSGKLKAILNHEKDIVKQYTYHYQLRP